LGQEVRPLFLERHHALELVTQGRVGAHDLGQAPGAHGRIELKQLV